MLVGRAVRVRSAVVADGDQLAAIWNHEVLWTDATTDTEPRDGRAQREWLERHRGDASAVVAAVGDEVLAYGSLSPYRPKPAFARTLEDSVYVKRGHRGAELGGHSMLARITSGNAASLRLHQRHGFSVVGVEREVAFKLGRWHDVTVLQ